MTNLEKVLNDYGIRGVNLISFALIPYSATGESANSLRYEVTFKNTTYTLTIYGRKYLKAMETGRGPRVNSEYQGFDKQMLQWMAARGIGADLPQKKKEQLARFLAYKINKEGDDLYKSGGRTIYTPVVDKIAQECIETVTEDFISATIKRIKNGFNDNATPRNQVQ